MTFTQKTNGDLEPREKTALQKMPLSKSTAAIRDEVAKLLAQRDAVLPQLAAAKLKTADLPLDAAVEKILPLSLRAELAAERLAQARERLFAGIVEDAQHFKDLAEQAVEAARVGYLRTKDDWTQNVRAAFNNRDATRMINGGAAANSSEVRDALGTARKADVLAVLAASVQKLLCRDAWVKKVAAGLAASGGRPHIMPEKWYLRNAGIVCPELVD